MPEELTQQLWSIGGKNNDVVGPDIASVAGFIAPTYLMHRVTGALAITGITIPHPDFEGLFIALPTGTFTWTAANNIALAGTAVVSKAIIFCYSKKTQKWYPSVIA